MGLINNAVKKAGEFISDSERWLYENGNLMKVKKALKWNKNNKPVDNFAELVKKIENDKSED